MAGLTLDSGVLIAADRGDRGFWAYWLVATRRGIVATVPAPALAQAWRGARSARMSQLLDGCLVEALDEPLAKAVGRLCARSRTSDIVDAAVTVSAATRRDRILTTDPDDLCALADLVDGVEILDLKSAHKRG